MFSSMIVMALPFAESLGSTSFTMRAHIIVVKPTVTLPLHSCLLSSVYPKNYALCHIPVAKEAAGETTAALISCPVSVRA